MDRVSALSHLSRLGRDLNADLCATINAWAGCLVVITLRVTCQKIDARKKRAISTIITQA